MDEEIETKARKLGEEHWMWIESILKSRQKETKHMFIEGFIHGYKHGSPNRKSEGTL